MQVLGEKIVYKCWERNSVQVLGEKIVCKCWERK